MKQNPNTNAAGLGGALGVVAAWLLGHYHVAVSAEQGAALSTVCATAILYVGRDGLRGIFRAVWRGSKQTPPPPPPPAPGA